MFDFLAFTMGRTAQDLINVIRGWIGFSEGNGKYRQIIDLYNSHRPLARGYRVKYGYVTDEDGTWVIDEDTGPVVKKIFEDRLAGVRKEEIAKELTEARVLRPSALKAYRNGVPLEEIKNPFNWSASSIANLLRNQAYNGTVINFRSHRVSFKAEIAKEKQDGVGKEKDARSFIALCRKFDGQEITMEVLRSLIDKIYVHEGEPIPGKKNRRYANELDIEWKFLGKVEISEGLMTAYVRSAKTEESIMNS